jgi:hypothetical protein
MDVITTGAAWGVAAALFLILIRIANVFRYIPNNQVGIVEKMWAMKGSIQSGFIALHGEAGFRPKVHENQGAAALARAQKDAETVKVTAAAAGAKSRLEGQGEADRTLAIGSANAQATKLSVDAYGGPEYRLAEQNFARFADALTKINLPQFLMSGTQGDASGGGLMPTAMLSSMFGRMMPDAREKLKEEAPKARSNGPA